MSYLKATILCAALSCSVVATMPGCQSDGSMKNPWASKANMSSKGDDMIAKGQKMKSDAAMMSDTDSKWGMSKSDMMAKGDKMIQDGQDMKAKANGM